MPSVEGSDFGAVEMGENRGEKGVQKRRAVGVTRGGSEERVRFTVSYISTVIQLNVKQSECRVDRVIEIQSKRDRKASLVNWSRDPALQENSSSG